MPFALLRVPLCRMETSQKELMYVDLKVPGSLKTGREMKEGL